MWAPVLALVLAGAIGLYLLSRGDQTKVAASTSEYPSATTTANLVLDVGTDATVSPPFIPIRDIGGVAPHYFTIDKEGILWFPRFMQTGENYSTSVNTLLAYDTSRSALKGYPLPSDYGNGETIGFADDGRGAVWIGWNRTLVAFDKSTGTSRKFALPEGKFQIADQLRDPDIGIINMIRDLKVDSSGKIWIARSYLHSLTRFDPETSTFEELPLPESFGAPEDLAISPDGKAIWMTVGTGGDRSYAFDEVGYYNIADRSLKELQIGTASIAADPAGELLYIARDGAGSLKRAEIDGVSSGVGGSEELHSIEQIYVSPWGNVWAAGRSAIYRLNGQAAELVATLPRGRIHPIPRGDFRTKDGAEAYAQSFIEFTTPVDAMAEDPAGNLWFSSLSGNKFGVIRKP